jgi:hypothetical protein
MVRIVKFNQERPVRGSVLVQYLLKWFYDIFISIVPLWFLVDESLCF